MMVGAWKDPPVQSQEPENGIRCYIQGAVAISPTTVLLGLFSQLLTFVFFKWMITRNVIFGQALHNR